MHPVKIPMDLSTAHAITDIMELALTAVMLMNALSTMEVVMEIHLA